MTRIRKEQIERVLTGFVTVTGVSVNGVSVVATSNITTALTTAGFAGGAVPLTNSSGESVEGLIISGASFNKVSVFLTSSKKPIYYSGEKVYGRLTHSAGVYTISLYYNNAGVQTAYNTGGAVSLDFLVNYRFSFKNVPADFIISQLQQYPYVDFNSTTNQGRVVEEKLNVTAPNTISSLTYVPTVGTKVTLYVNGKAEINTGGTPPFSMSGNVITWSATNAEYTVATTFTVMAKYQTLS